MNKLRLLLVAAAGLAIGASVASGVVPAMRVNGVQLTPLSSSPIASGKDGVWVDSSNLLRHDDGTNHNYVPAVVPTTKGDVVVWNGSTWVRVGAGSDGQALVADSTQAAGLKYAATSGGNGIYGDGSDGVVTCFDGTTTCLGIVPSGGVYTLPRHLYLADGSSTSGTAKIAPNSWIIFASGQLTVGGNGVAWDGTDATNNSAGAQLVNVNGFLGFESTIGSAGASGVAGAASGGNGITVPRIALGGQGGAGGTTGLNFGGSGGSLTLPVAWQPYRSLPSLLTGTLIAANGVTYPINGGSGGGAGGAAASGTSGAGGTGGGVVLIVAKNLVLNAPVTAKGGRGGNGSGAGAAAGGGGGGGGFVGLADSTLSGSFTPSVANCVPGGAGGNGANGAPSGSTGSNGTFVSITN